MTSAALAHAPAPSPANDNARAATDSRIARALAEMQRRPEQRWTVASLAKLAAMSRAAFARRFVCDVGTSPLAWLTEHRLALAARRLRRTADGLARIADDVGYANEFAFSRAFKRCVGVAPSVFRRAGLARPPARALRTTMRAA